ncbi:titin [Caerostris extrusa]|uniref:Titin n=1 Tax=Caerostris extrusa TaxID=172846 RepID=A0AAV4W640_CAEEX|nr:titin [Caerostris extrusa]
MPSEFLNLILTILRLKAGSLRNSRSPFCPSAPSKAQKLVLKCVVTGSPVPDIKWYREGVSSGPPGTSGPPTTCKPGRRHSPSPRSSPTTRAPSPALRSTSTAKDATTAPLTVTEDIVMIEKSDLYEPPKFVKPLLPISAPEGEPLEMTVEATGIPIPTLQWFHNNQELKPSRDFKVTTEGGKSSLLIAEVFPDDAGVYSVKATNKTGQASTTATLNVISEVESPKPEPIPPIFIKPLISQLVPEGEPVRMEVEVMACPDATFTWTFKKRSIKSSRDFQITSENNKSVLMVCEAFADDTGAYTCKAQNEAGTATTTATLTIESPPEDEVTEAPKFKTQLTPVKVMDSEEAKLSCFVTGEPMPKITWYHNNREVRENSEVWTTYRKDGYCELFLSEVFPEDMGDYLCKAVNKAGEAVTRTTLTVESYEYVPDSEIATLSMDKTHSADATLLSLSEESSAEEFVTIPELPEEEFVVPLENVEAKPGSTIRMQCKVTGIPKPKITWYKSGKVLKHSPQYQIFYEPTGTCSLTITRCTEEDTTEFSCEAHNKNGVDLTTSKVTVTEYKPRKPDWVVEMEEKQKIEDERPKSPIFEKPLEDTFVKTLGKKTTLECIIKGIPEPEVTWYHNEKAIDVSTGYYVIKREKNRSILIILKVTKETEGTYTCKAVNESGEAITTAYLYVGVTKEEHEAELKEKEKKPKRPTIKKATEKTTALQRTRELKPTKSVEEQAETTLRTQEHILVQQVTPQEQPSEVMPSQRPILEKAEVMKNVDVRDHSVSIKQVPIEDIPEQVSLQPGVKSFQTVTMRTEQGRTESVVSQVRPMRGFPQQDMPMQTVSKQGFQQVSQHRETIIRESTQPEDIKGIDVTFLPREGKQEITFDSRMYPKQPRERETIVMDTRQAPKDVTYHDSSMTVSFTQQKQIFSQQPQFRQPELGQQPQQQELWPQPEFPGIRPDVQTWRREQAKQVVERKIEEAMQKDKPQVVEITALPMKPKQDIIFESKETPKQITERERIVIGVSKKGRDIIQPEEQNIL